MDTSYLWTLVGVILPPVVQFVNLKVKKSWLKAVVAYATSIVVGALIYFMQGKEFKATDLFAMVLGVLALSQVAYTTYWKEIKSSFFKAQS